MSEPCPTRSSALKQRSSREALSEKASKLREARRIEADEESTRVEAQRSPRSASLRGTRELEQLLQEIQQRTLVDPARRGRVTKVR
jgi:hypothetical protein